ncbi:hypothetical protein [Endozoicomonas sp. 2B-B]
MIVRLLLVPFLILISNICPASVEQDLEEIKKNMKIANEKIEETKNKLKTPELLVYGPLVASGGDEFRVCRYSKKNPEANAALSSAVSYLTEVLQQMKFLIESYPEFDQAETLLNLHSTLQHPLEYVSSVSPVLLALPLAAEIESQLQKVEDVANKINTALNRI